MLSWFAGYDAELRPSRGQIVKSKRKSPSLNGIVEIVVRGDGGTFHVCLSWVKHDG